MNIKLSIHLQELEKKVKVMSKRRSELLLAREMDKSQQQKAEVTFILLICKIRTKMPPFIPCY